MKKAVFLDRDGTINLDMGYVHKIENFELIPRTVEALRMLQDAGYLIVIITSQSGIGRGYYTEEDFQAISRHMLALFSKEDIKISKIYHCPHGPEDGCRCRKPNTLLIKEAQKEFSIDLAKSYFIGDKTSDIKMGKDAGCTTILVKTGEAGKDARYSTRPDFTADDLYSGARLIIGMERKNKP